MTSRHETLNANRSIYEQRKVDLSCLDLWRDLVAMEWDEDPSRGHESNTPMQGYGRSPISCVFRLRKMQGYGRSLVVVCSGSERKHVQGSTSLWYLLGMFSMW